MATMKNHNGLEKASMRNDLMFMARNLFNVGGRMPDSTRIFEMAAPKSKAIEERSMLGFATEAQHTLINWNKREASVIKREHSRAIVIHGEYFAECVKWLDLATRLQEFGTVNVPLNLIFWADTQATVSNPEALQNVYQLTEAINRFVAAFPKARVLLVTNHGLNCPARGDWHDTSFNEYRDTFQPKPSKRNGYEKRLYRNWFFTEPKTYLCGGNYTNMVTGYRFIAGRKAIA